MSGSRKRSCPDDRAIPDPTDFLNSYFKDRGIQGLEESAAGKECVRRAEEARESFKRLRPSSGKGKDGSCGSNGSNSGHEGSSSATNATGGALRADALEAEVLTPAEKYNRRLVNNRKSAAAARVYQEVLKREQAYTLHQIAQQRDQYADEKSRMKADLDALKEKISKLSKENEQLVRQRAAQAEAEQASAVAVEIKHPVDVVVSVDKGRPSPVKASMPSSYGTASTSGLVAAVTTEIPGPFSFTPSQGESELNKMFAVTGSQSQNDDGEEKPGHLIRNLPQGSSVQMGVFHSQLSQGDVPSSANMRCSIGSEDLEFFLVQTPVSNQNRSLTAS